MLIWMMNLRTIKSFTRLNKYISDTMALILRLEKRKMPAQIKKLYELAEQGKAEIFIPAIVFSEIGYLSEKNKIDADLEMVKQYLSAHPKIKELPLNLKTVKTAFSIDDIPELHDRLIAASGKELDVEIITNDSEIQESRHVKTIWN